MSNILNKPELYNKTKIPPSLQEAEHHFISSKVGEKIKNSVNCKCCLKHPKKNFSILKNGINITNYGTTIPLYFHFSRFISGYLFIILLGSAYYIYMTTKVNYDFLNSIYNKDKLNQEKPKFSLDMTFLINKKLFRFEDFRRIVAGYSKISMWMEQIANVFLIIYSLYFVYSQRKMYKEIKKKIKISPSDFTVMIGNVHEDDSSRDIEKFIKKRLKEENYSTDIKIIGMSKATFKGNLQILKEKIEEKEDEIKAIKEIIKKNRDEIPPVGLKIAGNFIDEKLEEIQKYEKRKLKIIKKDLNMEKNSENCIMFLTVETTQEKDLLLSLKKSKSKNIHPNLRNFKIIEAPEPKDVKWQSIGYSRSQRSRKTFYGLIFIIITSPVFALAIIIIEFFKEYLVRKNNGSFFYENIIGIGLMPLAVTILTQIYIFILEYLSKYNKYIDFNRHVLRSAQRLILIYVIGFLVSQGVYMLFETKEIMEEDKVVGRISSFRILQSETHNFFLAEIFIVPISCFIFPEYFLMRYNTNKARKALKKSDYTTKYHFMTQKELNSIFTKPPPELDFMYSDLASCFFIIVSACFLVRTLPVFGLIFVFFQKYVDRLQLYKWTSQPSKDNYYLARKMRIAVADWTPRLFAVGRMTRIIVNFYVWNNLELYQHIINFSLLVLSFLPLQSYFEKWLDVKEKTEELRKSEFLRENFLIKEEHFLDFGKAKNRKYNELMVYFEEDYARMNPLSREVAEVKWETSRVTLSIFEGIEVDC